MKRDISSLSEKPFDLIIVGGGIYGLTLAWETARRGMRAALIEKEDFGSKTSANSLKTIHGGLRYLQQLDVKRMRESIRERTLLMYMAPHLVNPLGVVLPTYGYFMKGNEVMRLGMLMNDIISMDRNWTKDPGKTIPSCRVLSKEETLKEVPGIDPSRVRGAAFWTDAQVYSSERLGLTFLQSAVDRGACAANYVTMTGLLKENGRIAGVEAVDNRTNKGFEIKAPCVVNTAGGWANRVLESAGLPAQHLQLSTAMNLVIRRRLLPEKAAGVYGYFTHQLPGGPYHGRHVLFLAPWRHYTLAGTYHLPYSGDPDTMQVKEKEIEDFLEEINSAIPGNKVQREEVSFFHKGFLPMEGVNARTGEVNLAKHYSLIDHGRYGGPQGLITVIGVKYTTARDVSEKVASMIAGTLGKKKSKMPRRVRLTNGDIDNIQDFVESGSPAFGQWPEPVMHHMIMQYGTGYKKVLELAESRQDLSACLPGSDEVLGAEIAYAVKHEMALTLKDVVLRRTDLGSGECPADETLKACARIMALELGWNKKQSDDQIAAVRAVYRPAK